MNPGFGGISARMMVPRFELSHYMGAKAGTLILSTALVP